MRWRVPLFDLDLGREEISAVTEVVESGWLTMGAKTAEYEEAFAEFVGVDHAVAVSSGTAALHLALLAAGVGPGDEVVCPSLTFVATANAIRYCGASPVFADVASLDDWNLSAETIGRVMSPRTRAILVMHYGGHVGDMGPIVALARERGIAVVEDAAHAAGAARDAISAGAWGDAGCFSFFSNKNITTGEGGMVTTDREDIARKVRSLRSHAMTSVTWDRYRGAAHDYDVDDLGFNARMGELNAALGLVQLAHLNRRNERRGALVRRYVARLGVVPGLVVPFREPSGHSAHHVMPVLLPEACPRDLVMSTMAREGIQTSIHYRPVDTLAAYVSAGLGPRPELHNTHVIGRRTLTLPLYPSMRDDQVDEVCSALEEALGTTVSRPKPAGPKP